MNGKKIMKLFGVLALCLTCLWIARGNAQAVEPTEKPAEEKEVSYEKWLRRIMKENGKKVGKSGQCYYTYANHKKEIVIVGFQETAREIKIPDKIKGKKVTQIIPESPSFLGDYFENTNERYYVKVKPSKTKILFLPKYIRKIPGSTIQEKREEATAELHAERGVLSNLENFKVSPQNKHFMAKNGVLFSKDGKILWEYPDKRKASSYKIPKGVTKLGTFAFMNTRVKNVTMPDTVKSVGHWCFGISHGTSHLKSIRLSKNLKTIGEYAFSGTHLKKISLPEGLKVIKERAFDDTDINKLSLPKSLKSMGSGAFAGTKIKEVVIPGNIKKIPMGCFSSCKKLKKVTLKQGVKEIGDRSLEYCYHLKKLVIPSSVKKLGNPFNIAPFEGELEEGEEDPNERDDLEWRNAGVTLYVKKGSYVYRKFTLRAYWKETLKNLGMKVKIM